MKKNEIKPIIVTDNESGVKYTLEFTKATVKFAQLRGFNIDDVETKQFVALPDLFYYAFRAHHQNIPREKTDKILFEKLHGLKPEVIERLVSLYYLPFEELINVSDGEEEETKNAAATVEL